MKSKFLIVHVLILLLSLTGNVFSKALPPGSGIGDVPANVLILLDKSGSMGARMTSGAAIYYPEAVAFDSNGDIYAGQYHTYGIKKFTYATKAVDSSFGTSGIYKGTGNCRSYYPRAMTVHNGYLYVAGYYQHRVFRVNLSTGVCDWNHSGNYPNSVVIQNNILYSLNSSNMLVRNLSTNTNISCSYSGDLRNQGRYAYSMTVDHNGANMYLYRGSLYGFTIGSNKCPSTTKSFSTSTPMGSYSFGMKMHPTDDSILYATSYYSHRIYKVVLNSGKTGIQSSTFKGRLSRNASTTSSINMYYPRGIDIDATNNRIAVAEYHKRTVQIFDLNLGFIKEFGSSQSYKNEWST